MKTLTFILTFCFLLISQAGFNQTLKIYVSDAGNFNNPPWQILKFDENGENPQVFIDENLVWPQDILFLDEQNIVLISNLIAAGYISKYDMTTGTFLGNFAEDIAEPTRMKIGPDGKIYVLRWSNSQNKVLRYETDGTFVDEFTSAGVPRSIGLDWDAGGNLYVSSYSSHLVQKFNQEGNDQGTFISSNLVGPTNIWFDENGDLLVSDYLGHAVKRFGPDGDYLGIYIDGLTYTEGMAVFPNGNLLLGNGGDTTIKMFDPSGNFIEDLIPTGSGNLITPNAIVIRDASAVSIKENTKKNNFIWQDAKKGFYLDPARLSDIKTVAIYAMSGELLKNIQNVPSIKILSPGELNSGIYVVVANTSGGTALSQKIFIK